MKDLNWRDATLAQLYEIACNDSGASPIHKRQAAEEIARRKKKQYGRVNFREKARYGR